MISLKKKKDTIKNVRVKDQHGNLVCYMSDVSDEYIRNLSDELDKGIYSLQIYEDGNLLEEKCICLN